MPSGSDWVFTCLRCAIRYSRKFLCPENIARPRSLKRLPQPALFLGGFNLAFCVLSLLFLINAGLFPEDAQRSILFAVFAVAHGSQFISNVPVALDNRKGRGVWQIKGLMLFIFITDFVLMAANAAVAVIYVW